MKKIEMKRLSNNFLPLLMLIVCSILGTTDAWATEHGTHYGKVTVAKTGSGSVYIGTTQSATSGNQSETWNCGGKSSGDTKAYYLFATPDAANHYYFEKWEGNDKSSTTNPWPITTPSATGSQNNPSNTTYTATFKLLPKFYFAAGAEVDAAGNGTGKVAVAYSSTEPAAGNFSAGPVSAKTDVWATAITDGSKTATAYYFAKADAGMTFMGWYDENGVQKTKNTTYSVQQTSTTKADDATPEVYYARFRDPSIKFEPSVELAGQDGATEVTLKVDDEQVVSYVNVDDAVLSTLNAPTITEVSRVDVGSDPIVVWDAANRKLTANRAGTATVSFSHPATDGFNAGNFTFTIHVEKITPEFSWKTSVLLAGQSYTLTDLVETPSDGAWNIVSSKESVFASISQAGTQSATANIGTVTLTFSQGLSYKYNAIPAASQEFKVYTNEGFATYLVNGKTYTDLGVAASEANKLSKNKYIVVATDGTVVPGNYTIPAGVTLVIPYTENSTTEKKILSSAAYNIVVNRTLTLVEGVNITVYGTITVAAELQSGDASHNPCGFPVGGVGVLDMGKGGHIDVEKDGKLLAWGFVKGQGMLDGNNTKNVGTITAKDGSLIRECYGVVDWGGGSLTVALQGAQSKMRIYPFQGYYVQNIEVPVRFEYGAKEQLYTNVYGGGGQNAADEIYFIGNTSGVLFRVMSNKGAVTKWYDATTDHMVVELEGDAKLDNLKIVVMGYTINANDYDLPILSNMHIKLKDCNLTLASPIVLQPSAIFEITKGSSLTLSTNMFVYDVDQWEKIVMGKYFKPLPVIPTPHFTRGDGNSRDMMEDAKLIVDGTMTIDANGILYTTAGGGNVMGNGGGSLSWGRTLPGSKNVCGYTGGTSVNGNTFNASLKDEYKVTNPCDPARMHNDNGTYTAPLSNTTFDNIHGRWFKRADAKERDDDHTYNFTYINGDNTAATAKSVYSADKTGLTAGYKWVNVTTDSEHANTFLGEDGNLYNWTTNSEWLQLVATGDGTYAGSDDNLYTYADGAWHKGTITMGDDCLYDFEGTKKALVGNEFIAITHDEYDEVFVDASGNYYMLFDGCVWQHAEKVPNTYKAYVVLGNYYVWIDNAWTEVGKENDLFYTTDDQNLKHYYEYDGAIFAWVPVQNKVRISTSAGEEREFRTWDDAMLYTSQYNDPTITLLGDCSTTSIFTITGNAKTKDITIDLNDHVLDANVGSQVTFLKLNNSKVTLTVTDNSDRQRGELKVTCSVAKRVDAINVTLGKVVMEAGKVSIHNTSTSTSGNAAAIYAAAGQSVTMNGGELNAMSTRYPYGIYGASSAALASTSIVTMNGGTINATSKDYAYGIYGNGIINMNGGTINATTTTVNGVAASSYAYGIYANATPKANDAESFRSVLTMTGGTINAISGNQYAYGVYTHAAATTATTSTDGKQANRAAAKFSIAGGEINAEAVSTLAYGICDLGCYNSYTDKQESKQVPHPIRNVKIRAKANGSAYGIFVNLSIADYHAAELYGNVVIDNVDSYAETTGTYTAVGVHVNATAQWLNRYRYYNISADNRKTWYVEADVNDGDLTHEAINGTTSNTNKYQIGNHVLGAKAVINSGKFYGKSATTGGYGVYVNSAASSGDNSRGYAEVTINGGTFTGESQTTGGYGIQNLGNTVVKGGTFTGIATTTDAYGACSTTGTLTLDGGEFNSISNGNNSYGVAATGTVDASNTGTHGHGTLIVNEGVVVNARSISGAGVYAVYAIATNGELTQTKYNNRSANDKKQYFCIAEDGTITAQATSATTNDSKKQNFYAYRIGQYVEGGEVIVNGGTFNANAYTDTSIGAGAGWSNLVHTTEEGYAKRGIGVLTIHGGTFNVSTETSSTCEGVRSYGTTYVDGGTFNLNPKTTTAVGVKVYNGTTTIDGGTFNANATTTTAVGASAYFYKNTDYRYFTTGNLIINGGTFNVKTFGGSEAYGVQVAGEQGNFKAGKVTGAVAKDYAIAAQAEVTGGTFIMTPSNGTKAYATHVYATQTKNAEVAYPTLHVKGGFFKMNGTTTSGVYESAHQDNQVITGGHFSKDTGLASKTTNKTYVRDPYKVIDCIHPEYKKDYPFEVAEVCTITFKDDEDHTLWSGKQPKGTMAIYPLNNGTPEKAATSTNSYDFTGWDTPLVTITGDATYVANFTAVAKRFMVTWKDEAGNEIDHKEWASGQTPTHDDPVKEGYTFTGWTPSITAVVDADQNYKATFSINSYTIIWLDEDGSEIKRETKQYGSTLTAPKPTKEGYTFKVWTPGVEKVTGDQTYQASYLLNVAEVTDASTGKTTPYTTWSSALTAANKLTAGGTLKVLDDVKGLGAQTFSQTFTLDLNGHTLASATTKFITMNTAGKTLTIDDSQGGGRIELIAANDGESYAVFINNGTVVFNNGTIHGENVHATAADARKGIGVRIETANGKFVMNGGRVEGQSKQIGTGIYAVGPVEVNGGVITGTARSKARAIYSKAASLVVRNAHLEATTTTSTGAYGIYSDTNDKAPTLTIDNVTIIATSATTDAYGLNLYSGNKGTISNVKIQATTAPIDADATAANVSITSGFFDKETNLAKYIGTKKLVALTTEPEKAEGYNYKIVDAAYQITFLDEDGSELQKGNVEAGVRPVFLGEEPTKPSNPKTSYEFAGWNDGVRTYTAAEIPVANAAATYTATFIEHGVEYPITFYNIDGKGGTYVQMVEYGEVPVYDGPAPYQLGDIDNVAYIFNGWTPVLVEVTEPTTYEATFRLEIAVDVTFHANGRGTDPVALKIAKGAAIGRPADQLVDCQHIVGWYTEAGCINEWNFASDLVDETDIDLYAKWATKTYTITWLDEFGEQIDQTVVNCGAVPTHADLTKPSTAAYSYEWKGWNKTIVAASADATYKSLGFTQVPKRYAITFNTNGGSAIAPIEQEVGSDITAPADPTREGYTFAGWTPAIPATMPACDMTITAQWTINQYNVSWDANGGALSGVYTQGSVDYGTTIVPPTATKNGYNFAGWSPEVPAMVTGNLSFTAMWTADEFGDVMDIVDWSANSVTLNMNGYGATNGKWGVVVNGVKKEAGDRNSDRTLTFTGLTLRAGEKLNIKVYGGDVLESNQNYTIPSIFESGWVTSLNLAAPLYIKSGTMTVPSTVTISQLTICPGAEVAVTGGTLTITDKLILRGRVWGNEQPKLTTTGTGKVSAANTYYTRIIADKSAYYPFGLPFASNVENVRLSNGVKPSFGETSNWNLKYYDGAARANDKDGWKNLISGTIEANTYYIMGSGSAYYREFYFPITLGAATTSMPIAKYASDNKLNAGWNGLCSPFTGMYHQTFSDPSEAVKITTKNSDNATWWQRVAQDMYPFFPFFYQTEAAGTLTFGDELEFAASAPGSVAARAKAEEEVKTVRTQWIQLFLQNERDEQDETNLYVHPTKFTSGYDGRYDLAKMLGEGSTRPQVYTRMACGDLAFNALPDSVAETRIPVIVNPGSAKVLNFTLGTMDYLDRIEAIYLVDEALATTTNLLNSDYEWNVQDGTQNRFYLSVVMAKAPENATGINANTGDNANKVKKVFINEKLYIIRGNQIYNANGKLVQNAK